MPSASGRKALRCNGLGVIDDAIVSRMGRYAAARCIWILQIFSRQLE
jgi:hypothetical protein